MKAIQEELGGAGSGKEIEEMRLQASKKEMVRFCKRIFEKELKKLQE